MDSSLKNHTMIVWEDPEKDKPGYVSLHPEDRAIQDALKSRPGEWARVREWTRRSHWDVPVAYRGPEFEATLRKIPDYAGGTVTRMYVRYVGKEAAA